MRLEKCQLQGQHGRVAKHFQLMHAGSFLISSHGTGLGRACNLQIYFRLTSQGAAGLLACISSAQETMIFCMIVLLLLMVCMHCILRCLRLTSKKPTSSHAWTDGRSYLLSAVCFHTSRLHAMCAAQASTWQLAHGSHRQMSLDQASIGANSASVSSTTRNCSRKTFEQISNPCRCI